MLNLPARIDPPDVDDNREWGEEGEVAAVATRGSKATGLISRTGALLTSTG